MRLPVTIKIIGGYLDLAFFDPRVGTGSIPPYRSNLPHLHCELRLFLQHIPPAHSLHLVVPSVLLVPAPSVFRVLVLFLIAALRGGSEEIDNFVWALVVSLA